MATAALLVASGWLPAPARAVARGYGGSQYVRSEPFSQISLCQDTLGHTMQQLWPASQKQALNLSPTSFESRLLQLAPLLQDLQALCAVSQKWASMNAAAWCATHQFLFQEPGTKNDLRRRYATSMRELVVKNWIQHSAMSVPEGLVGHIASFVPMELHGAPRTNISI